MGWKTVTDEEKQKYEDIRSKKKEEYAQFWIDHPELIGYKKRKGGSKGDPNKLQLPLKTIMNIIKSDPDVNKVSKKASKAIARSVELFLKFHAKQALKVAE